MFKVYDVKNGERIEIKSIKLLLYGEGGVGKTTLANTGGENPILLDFDNGGHRALGGNKVFRIERYDDIFHNWVEFVKSLEPFDTIIIDSVDKLLDLMIDFIIRNYADARKSNMKVYGYLKDEFKKLLTMAMTTNKNIIMVSHQKLENSVGNKDNRRIVPNIAGSNMEMVTSNCDLIGYVSAVDDVPYVSFTPKSIHYGKNPTKIPDCKIPDIKDDSKYLLKIINSVKKKLSAELETQKQDDDVFKGVQKLIDKATGFEDLNLILASCTEFSIAQKKQVKAMTDKKLKEFSNHADVEFKNKKYQLKEVIPVEGAEDEIF